jgi:hypothetical protein
MGTWTTARGRSRWRGVALTLALLGAAPALAGSDEVQVPIPLQASLLAKVATYDQNFVARSGDVVNVLVVYKDRDGKSQRLAQQMRDALHELKILADRSQKVEAAPLQSAPQLANRCRENHVAIVYLAPGFSAAEVRAIAGVLAGQDVLSASAAAADVAEGVVLGFEQISGKPKIVVNLKQAKSQNVLLSSSLLALAKVYR